MCFGVHPSGMASMNPVHFHQDFSQFILSFPYQNCNSPDKRPSDKVNNAHRMSHDVLFQVSFDVKYRKFGFTEINTNWASFGKEF